ncbi:MAG: DUF5009 domain-containing protein [Verrucomicrobia bacterium]|nr:DUF5009 domain-containing protein [Verrucomicrobiota bacterium]
MNPPAPSPTPASPRLASLDALRGFDMFWILGADAIVRGLGEMSQTAPLKFIAAQLEHKDWAGFAFYDLIFPLFVFIVGVSLVFSLTRTVAQHGRAAAVKRVLIRAAVLFFLGIFYSGGLTARWPDIRLLGVLQRIALAYGAAGLLFCFFRPRVLAWIGVLLLTGYWALLTFVPIRPVQLERGALPAQMAQAGMPRPTLEQAHQFFDRTSSRIIGGYEAGLNFANHLDFKYLPGRKYDHYWDPEGLLSTLPAIATCLLGVAAGLLLRRSDRTDAQKIAWLAGAGLAALAIGWTWHLQFPVVKKIWTSSFVLVAGGWSLLLLAAFYYVVDVRQWRRWCRPFIWIGMNPITLYIASNVVGFRRVAPRLAGGDVKAFFDAVTPGCGNLVVELTGLGLMLCLAWFLHRRRIFLRV